MGPNATADNGRSVDNPEAVTLLPRAAGDQFAAAVAVGTAKRRNANRSDVLTHGLLGKAALVWHLYPSTSSDPAYAPKVRDVIADGAGVRWSVLEARTDSFGRRFRCVCVKER